MILTIHDSEITQQAYYAYVGALTGWYLCEGWDAPQM
jgi:hypothetical protein